MKRVYKHKVIKIILGVFLLVVIFGLLSESPLGNPLKAKTLGKDARISGTISWSDVFFVQKQITAIPELELDKTQILVVKEVENGTDQLKIFTGQFIYYFNKKGDKWIHVHKTEYFP
jgi:hypothetical protein